jgi:hypothetical protein
MRRGLSLIFATALVAFAAAPAASADPGDSAARSAAAWQLTGVVPAPQVRGAQPAVQPDRFQALELNRSALEQVLTEVPGNRVDGTSAGTLTLSLPTPTGSFERFAVQRTPVMAPGLAARHPGISTFAGSGIDVPGSTVRIDVGSLGLHASVIGPEGAWYVDPAYNREQGAYLSYFGRDLTRNQHAPFQERGPLDLGDSSSQTAGAPAAAANTVQLRTYRLALVSDPS